MILRMNQDTYEDFLGYQEPLGMTWGTHPVDERVCEALSSLENKTNRQEIMRTNVCENEPRHVWRPVKTSRITRDDMSHHETS